MKECPLVSIIIPVYNIEKYVEKCLDSICSQTYQNIETIVIDDCSTDRSLQICEQYARKNNKIKMIYNAKNCGLSASRNIGMQQARGNYYMFVDGDDWIEHDLVEQAVKLLQQNEQADTAHWGYCCIDEDGTVGTKEVPILYPQNFVGQSEIFEKFINTLVVSFNDLYYWFSSGKSYYEAIHSKKQMGSVWRYLLSARVIKENNLQFHLHAGRGEDIVFMMCYLQKCRGIVNYAGPSYNYLQRTNSLSRDDIVVYKKIELMEAMEETVKYAQPDKREELRDKWRGQRVLVVMNTARRLVKVTDFKQGYTEYRRLAVHPISQDAYKKIRLQGINIKYKIAIGMIKYKCYFLFYFCIYLMNKIHLDLAPMD